MFFCLRQLHLKPRSCAQFAPGCKFAPGVQNCTRGVFLAMWTVFLEFAPECKFAPGCKFAPAFEVVQIYLHPGANCAHERKMHNFYTFWLEILIKGRHFLLRCCLKSIKNKFQVFFIETHIMFIILIILQHDIWTFMGTVDRPLQSTHFLESKHQVR